MDLHLLDFLNSFFEYTAGGMIWLNIWTIWKDKTIKGVSLFATVYFAALASFNLFYYWELNQKISFFAGVFVAIGDILYLYLFLKYRKNK
jgi:hypothetical protein